MFVIVVVAPHGVSTHVPVAYTSLGSDIREAPAAFVMVKTIGGSFFVGAAVDNVKVHLAVTVVIAEGNRAAVPHDIVARHFGGVIGVRELGREAGRQGRWFHGRRQSGLFRHIHETDRRFTGRFHAADGGWDLDDIGILAALQCLRCLFGLVNGVLEAVENFRVARGAFHIADTAVKGDQLVVTIGVVRLLPEGGIQGGNGVAVLLGGLVTHRQVVVSAHALGITGDNALQVFDGFRELTLALEDNAANVLRPQQFRVELLRLVQRGQRVGVIRGAHENEAEVEMVSGRIRGDGDGVAEVPGGGREVVVLVTGLAELAAGVERDGICGESNPGKKHEHQQQVQSPRSKVQCSNSGVVA